MPATSETARHYSGGVREKSAI